jgi:2-dehydropantoate 2-reductase
MTLMEDGIMRLLIYGAGVIGCWYAILFSKAGYDTTLYARGKRLELFRKEGLRYEIKGKIHKADVKVIDKLENEEHYDFIFLTVKENQVHIALEELASNKSSNIVTMVNTSEGYENWERLCGEGRIIPAFPGAGGSFKDGILKAALTPYIIQPTTFAEINGCCTERLQKLARIFKKSKIPYQIVKNMQEWQLCHLAMVVPIADAYYMAQNPKTAWKEADVMQKTAAQMKYNFQTLHKSGIVLSPRKMNMFRLLPVGLLKIGLIIVFKSDFGDVFMYQHSMNAPDEMRTLREQFYAKNKWKEMEAERFNE